MFLQDTTVNSNTREGKRIWERTPLWVYGITFVPATLVVVIAVLQPWVPQEILFKDPIYLTGGQPYYGVISHIGVLLLWGTAVTCFFVGSLSPQKQRETFWFLVVAGGISGLLALDDLFLLHEVGYPAVFGVPETITFLLYGALILAYVVKFRTPIGQHDYVLLILGLFFLLLSVGFDKTTGPRAQEVVESLPGRALLVPILEMLQPAAAVIEDGPKLIGICAWSAFHVRAAWRIAKDGLR